MGIKLDTFKDGVFFADAYHRLTFAEIDHTGKLIACLETFPNRTVRDQNKCVLSLRVLYLQDLPEEVDKTKAAYLRLKELPDFAGAEDV